MVSFTMKICFFMCSIVLSLSYLIKLFILLLVGGMVEKISNWLKLNAFMTGTSCRYLL